MRYTSLILLIAIITSCCFIERAFSVCTTDSWTNLSRNEALPYVYDISRSHFHTCSTRLEDIPKLKYKIDLGRKQTSRKLTGFIDVQTYIDIEKNTAVDRIDLHFMVDDVTAPGLMGENIAFVVSGDEAKSVEILHVSAPGWKFMISCNQWIYLENIREESFGSIVVVFVLVKDQDKFKGRSFEIFNRNALQFDALIKLSEGYNFLSFDETLPYDTPRREDVKTLEDTLISYTKSSVTSKQITMDTVKLCSRLIGSDYHGNEKIGSNIPKKVIKCGYTYDYQEDINARIVKESASQLKKTLLAIQETSQEALTTSQWWSCLAIGITVILFFVSILPPISRIRSFFKKLLRSSVMLCIRASKKSRKVTRRSMDQIRLYLQTRQKTEAQPKDPADKQ